jgi:cbb3-type cytochrome oxidase subunit 1
MFIFVGVMSYLLASTQRMLEAFRSLQQVWHFTDFTVCHSHFTMYGNHRIRDMGRRLRTIAISNRQEGHPAWHGTAFLDGSRRLLH